MPLPHLLTSTTDVAPGDHLCWSFAAQEECDAAFAGFAAEGLARGEQVLVITGEGLATAYERLTDLPGRDDHLAAGRLVLRTVAEQYGPVAGLAPAAQVVVLGEALAVASAAGYTGLRVATDLTPALRSGLDLTGLLAFELAVDAVADGTSLTVLCAYDETLGAAVCGPLAGAHALRNRGTAVGYAVRSRGARSTLSGEVDATVAPDVEVLLRALEAATTGDLSLDLAGLHFLDSAGARAVHRSAERLEQRGRRLRVHGASRTAGMCLGLFGVAVHTGRDRPPPS